MNILKMFNSDLIDLEMQARSQEELFRIVGKRLSERDYVTENYLKGILTREREFPTGLITQYLNIALPHGDACNVKKSFVYVVKVTDPIVMKQMGDDQKMNVSYFFFLGINNAKKQVGLLSTLMSLFMTEEFVTEFKQCVANEEVYKLLKKYIGIGAMNNV